MTKKLTAAILALVTCLTLASCNAVIKEDPEDFDFTELSGIPLADIKIAYIHTQDTSLMRDLDELCKKESLLSREFLKLDISEIESFDNLLSELYAKGYNVFFLDGALPAEFIQTLPDGERDVYFISYRNDVPYAKNIISFDDDYLEYSYLLGVIAAYAHGSESIGIISDGLDRFADFNAFASGVKLVNSNIKVVVSERIQTLTQNGCEAIFVPHGYKFTQNTKAVLYGFESDREGSFLFADYSEFFEKCITSVTDGTFEGTNVSLGMLHGLMDESLKALGLSEELTEKTEAIKKYFVGGMPVFSANQLMISGDKVISVHEVVMDNRGNTVIDENDNYYYYSENDLLLCESYEELIGGKMNYYLQNIEVK